MSTIAIGRPGRLTPCPVCRGRRYERVWRDLPELRFGLRERFSVWRCPDCGTHVTDPQPDQEYLDRLYQAHYVPAEYVPPNREAIAACVAGLRGGQDALLRQWRRENSTDIPALFYDPTIGRYFRDCSSVLDVGAYAGENMLWLQAGGWRVSGVEPNPQAARLALQFGLDVRVSSLEDSRLPPASFDAVYLSYVIEHLLDPRAMLAELWRILKPGGRLLLTTHNVESLWRYVFGPYWINWHTPFHLYHFSVRSLGRLAEESGFRALYLGSRTPVFWLLLSFRAARDSLLRGQPNLRLWDRMTDTVNRRLLRWLRLERGRGRGDCTIAIFERAA
ncbi:MAG: class I SAM-dependent methyltransferase [Planctomycetes bacterium]|nr:class I SAM-dependent methyltransferase [Planctomycetota bacterium]